MVGPGVGWRGLYLDCWDNVSGNVVGSVYDAVRRGRRRRRLPRTGHCHCHCHPHPRLNRRRQRRFCRAGMTARVADKRREHGSKGGSINFAAIRYYMVLKAVVDSSFFQLYGYLVGKISQSHRDELLRKDTTGNTPLVYAFPLIPTLPRPSPLLRLAWCDQGVRPCHLCTIQQHGTQTSQPHTAVSTAIVVNMALPHGTCFNSLVFRFAVRT